jgi:hypothetical protein
VLDMGVDGRKASSDTALTGDYVVLEDFALVVRSYADRDRRTITVRPCSRIFWVRASSHRNAYSVQRPGPERRPCLGLPPRRGPEPLALHGNLTSSPSRR